MMRMHQLRRALSAGNVGRSIPTGPEVDAGIKTQQREPAALVAVYLPGRTTPVVVPVLEIAKTPHGMAFVVHLPESEFVPADKASDADECEVLIGEVTEIPTFDGTYPPSPGERRCGAKEKATPGIHG